MILDPVAHPDFMQNPETSITYFSGKRVLWVDPPCFGQLSRTDNVEEFTYHCHDLVSTILGDTNISDLFLEEFKKYCIFDKHKDNLKLVANPDHSPGVLVRSVDLTVDATEINYTEFLLIVGVLRTLQECPSNVTAFLKVNKKLPDKSFLYNWLVSQYVEDPDLSYQYFTAESKRYKLYPNARRLEGHGIINSMYRYKFPFAVDESVFLKTAFAAHKSPMGEASTPPKVYSCTKEALGWDVLAEFRGIYVEKLLPITDENINIILEGATIEKDIVRGRF